MVIHILKDGSQVNDITGRIVRMEDAGSLYAIITEINRGSRTVRKTVKKEVS